MARGEPLALPKFWAKLTKPSDVGFIEGPGVLRVRQEMPHEHPDDDGMMHAWVLIGVTEDSVLWLLSRRRGWFPIVPRDRRGRRNHQVTTPNLSTGSYWLRFVCNNTECSASLLVDAGALAQAVEDGVTTPGYNPWKDKQ